jgi:glycosyltransferase involved in cell wall biosynthesis
VQRRLQHLAELADVLTLAPIALVQYGDMSGNRLRIGKRRTEFCRQDGPMTVLSPRWFYPPLSGSLTAVWLFLRLLPVVLRLRRAFPFDVIDTHFGHPEGIAGAMLSAILRVPFTMTLRGNEPKHSRTRFSRLAMSWALSRASGVFAVSERLRQFSIGLGADPRKAKVIPNGVDSTVFYPRDRAACRAKFGFHPDRPLIISAGALVERKGHQRIIQALSSSTLAWARPQLAIAGGSGPEGTYEDKIRILVSTLGLQEQVRFLGPLPPETLAEVMSAADVSCLASTNEGWPNVVHEALACGTPVVASDVGAVPEMLAAGKYGIVFDVKDQSSLERSLDTALRTQWDRRAIAAWGQARNWCQVASEVLQEMCAIVGPEHGTRVVGQELSGK